jgi:uncharacterized delta-60 repeat protein
MNAILCRALPLFFAVAVSVPLPAGIGGIDPAFGEAGQLKAGLIAVLPDGKILMSTPDGYARKTPDGKPDPGFGSNGLQSWPLGFVPDAWVNWLESRTATTPDGSTLVSGYIPDAGSNRSAGAVARLLPDGGIDASFGEQGIVRLPLPGVVSFESQVHMPEAVTIQPDGKILVMSFDYRDYWSEDGTVYLQRFESDGRRDSTFGSNGQIKPSISMSELMGIGRMQYLRDGRIKFGDATYLDALGQLQAAPADSGIPDTTNPGWFTVGRLPGGDSIVASLGSDSARSVLRIARVDSAGNPVVTFGPNGTGMSAIEERPSGRIISSSVSPDGRFAYVVIVSEPTYCVVSRITLDQPGSGLLDPGFGQSGRVVMNPTVTGLRIFRIVGQANGASVVGGNLRTLRLLGTPAISPGAIGPSATGWVADSRDSRIKLVFSRSGGTDGAVGLRYETYSATPNAPGVLAAAAGMDYVAQSGRIEWANGDSSDKPVFIELLPGAQSSSARSFRVRMDEPSGGAFLSANDTSATILAASAAGPPAPAAPSQASPGAASPATQGGGGALDLAMLLVCLSLLGLSRRAERNS